MKEKERKFRTRNGYVLQQSTFRGFYTVVTSSEALDKYGEPWEVGALHCLLIPSEGEEFATGGAHGKDFDIVEELFLKET